MYALDSNFRKSDAAYHIGYAAAIEDISLAFAKVYTKDKNRKAIAESEEVRGLIEDILDDRRKVCSYSMGILDRI